MQDSNLDFQFSVYEPNENFSMVVNLRPTNFCRMIYIVNLFSALTSNYFEALQSPSKKNCFSKISKTPRRLSIRNMDDNKKIRQYSRLFQSIMFHQKVANLKPCLQACCQRRLF